MPALCERPSAPTRTGTGMRLGRRPTVRLRSDVRRRAVSPHTSRTQLHGVSTAAAAADAAAADDDSDVDESVR